tara:strand:- start:114 stop:299 length:186 start_codon:yes stop_codon:yes gene_type:complete
MNKEGVKKLQYERDMLLCKYIALCEMMADMLNLDTEEIEEIINIKMNNGIHDLTTITKLNG